jgi:hypothetical protein
MPRPDYLICLECETEVEDFTWRDGEVRRAACEVCGNSDPDSFALPEDFDQDAQEEEEGEEDEGEEELIEDYDEFEEEEEQ